MLLVSLAPFLAFLNSMDVRRPTPNLGKIGELSREETLIAVSSCEDMARVCRSFRWSVSSFTSVWAEASLGGFTFPLLLPLPLHPCRL